MKRKKDDVQNSTKPKEKAKKRKREETDEDDEEEISRASKYRRMYCAQLMNAFSNYVYWDGSNESNPWRSFDLKRHDKEETWRMIYNRAYVEHYKNKYAEFLEKAKTIQTQLTKQGKSYFGASLWRTEFNVIDNLRVVNMNRKARMIVIIRWDMLIVECMTITEHADQCKKNGCHKTCQYSALLDNDYRRK